MKRYINHKIWGCQGDLFNIFKYSAVTQKIFAFPKILQLLRKPNQKHSLKKKFAVPGITRQNFKTYLKIRLFLSFKINGNIRCEI